MTDMNQSSKRGFESFSVTVDEDVCEMLKKLIYELRWSRSKIIRLAIKLMFKTHRKDPLRYGMQIPQEESQND